jgi:protein-S-isoprenylcysteine O-methyltransferase Ste14
MRKAIGVCLVLSPLFFAFLFLAFTFGWKDAMIGLGCLCLFALMNIFVFVGIFLVFGEEGEPREERQEKAMRRSKGVYREEEC